MRKPWHWLALSAALVVCDQITKYVVVHGMQLGSPLELLPFLSLTLTYNPGAAFSFLAGAGGWQRWFFVAVAAVAAVVITMLIFRNRGDSLLCLALSLVLGGAVGNLIDRLVIGAVVDFVVLHWRGWSWPAFNLADSCISIGAVLLVWDSLLGSRVKPARSP